MIKSLIEYLLAIRKINGMKISSGIDAFNKVNDLTADESKTRRVEKVRNG
jgi:hypothetical protein